LTAGQKGYFAANQILPTKALLASPLRGLLAKPLLGKGELDQNVARYQSGQLKLSKGKTEPAYLPAVHTPAGTFGSDWSQLLGMPENPVPDAAGVNAHAKNVKTATKAASTYAKEVARLRARDVQ
jgi:hypothetical protein